MPSRLKAKTKTKIQRPYIPRILRLLAEPYIML
jgi:hypothetical protein